MLPLNGLIWLGLGVRVGVNNHDVNNVSFRWLEMSTDQYIFFLLNSTRHIKTV